MTYGCAKFITKLLTAKQKIILFEIAQDQLEIVTDIIINALKDF